MKIAREVQYRVADDNTEEIRADIPSDPPRLPDVFPDDHRTRPATIRVWWSPQIPGPRFCTPVADLAQAKLLLTTLARYDLFHLEHNIKPDFANAGGLEVFEDGEWCEWVDEDGDHIGDVMLREAA